MNFNSLAYYIFLPATLLFYFTLPRRLKNIFLLAASYFFYMCWQPVYALLMLACTVVTYACSLLLEDRPSRRRLWLALCFIINLLILFFFKYYNFAAELSARMFELIHIQVVLPFSHLLLPIGISFYTFQALGYTVDVYRGQIRAERSFLAYALFVSFFPPLVAGPIERARNLLPQLKIAQKFSAQRLFEGLTLFFWGLFKKLVIADRLAILVNYAFDGDPAYLGGFQYALAAAAFSLQIYCDFSAYSDIARGSGRMLGIELMRNFDAPYLSRSIREFWRRWHISLSTWFKDYLYFPLGGSRCATSGRRYLNLLIVFVVSGLWHGAALTFLAWGLLHGIFQAASVASAPLRGRMLAALRLSEDNRLLNLGRIIFNFSLVTFAFIFFRADTISGACGIVQAIVLDPFSGSPWQMGLTRSNLAALFAAVALLFAVDIAARRIDLAARVAANPALRYTVYFLLLALIFIFGCYGSGFDPRDFIYFQF